MNAEGTTRERRPPSPLGLILWAIFFGLLALWSAQNIFHCAAPSRLIGTAAPDLAAPIVAGEGAGDRVSLGALRGRPVMLDFWASWCPPCRASIPILGRLAQRHAGAGLVTYGVNVETEQSADFVRRAHRSFGATFPSLFDDRWDLRAAFEVESLPTLVLIDRRGVVRWVEVGVPSEQALESEIQRLLAEPP